MGGRCIRSILCFNSISISRTRLCPSDSESTPDVLNGVERPVPAKGRHGHPGINANLSVDEKGVRRVGAATAPDYRFRFPVAFQRSVKSAIPLRAQKHDFLITNSDCTFTRVSLLLLFSLILFFSNFFHPLFCTTYKIVLFYAKIFSS